MKTPSARSPVVVDLLIVALTLAAPVFGATNQLLPKACLILGAAVVWCLSPPTRPLPWRMTALFGALALTGFFALLPRGVFPVPSWALTLQQLGVALPATVSPQPWLTLEKALLLCGGLVWAWYLLCRQWHLPRRVLLELYAGGVLLITLWSFLLYTTWKTSALTDGARVFGIFPNRNQTANFTALGGLIMLALALDGGLSRSRAVVPWLVAFCVALLGVFLAGSRAGVLLLGIGSAIWLVWMSIALNRRGWIVLSAGLILLMLAAMFVYQSALMERLTSIGTAQSEGRSDLRMLLHKDGLPLLQASS